MKPLILRIKITKDVLKRSMMCGVDDDCDISTSCAIAHAVRDVFPNAAVSLNDIYVYGKLGEHSITLPVDAKLFISRFDALIIAPEKRLDLPEFEFEVEVPASIVDMINIDALLLSPTLELVA